MGISKLGDLLLVYHSSLAPSDEEWRGVLVAAQEQLAASGRHYSLIWTEGGGPNAAQRGELNDLLDSSPTSAAVLTKSVLARGMAKALTWIGKLDLRVFDPANIDDALKYLGTELSREDVTRELDRMKKAVEKERTG